MNNKRKGKEPRKCTLLVLAEELEVEPWKVMHIAKWCELHRQKPEIEEAVKRRPL